LLQTGAGMLQMSATPVRLAIRYAHGNARLNLYQGQVEILTQGGSRALLEAGQRVDFSARSISAPAPAQLSGESWLHNRLSAEAMPLEDLLGVDEQPNLPGTVDGHPNWQRRFTLLARDLLDDSDAARRLELLAQAREQAWERDQ
jgi:4-alpha-glucanotransferase